jgi:aryl-alcohol dehydrogenase-like predicted oxidoreductase
MTMGEEGAPGAVRNWDLSECADILAVFAAHGYTEIDTARMYGGGTTEKVASWTRFICHRLTATTLIAVV